MKAGSFFLIACLLLSLCGVESQGAENRSPTLRVVAYNIKHGLGMDGKVDLPRIAGVLEKLKPDLVALQEVDNKCTRSGGVDQAAELGRLLGMHHRFGKFMDFQGGEYGLAVLSRYPIQAAKRHVLAEGAEPRCALEILVDPPESKEPVSFLSIHHDWTSEDFRIAQVNDLVEALSQQTGPIVLAGDFNARPKAPSLDRLRQAGFSFVKKEGPPHTVPSPAPRVEIDYFLTRGFNFDKPPVSRVHDERVASDHRPIVATLPLSPKEEGTSR